MLLNEALFQDETETESKWREVDSKTIVDSDGFTTDYTWYTDGDEHICIFGDKDLYTPDNTTPDVDGFYGEEGAKAMADWFNNYKGFDEDSDDILTEDWSTSLPKWLTRELKNNSLVRNNLLRRNYDLANLKFVKIPKDEIPTSGFHPILKDATKQLVYLLRDEKQNHVYLPGISDADMLIFKDRDELYKGTPIKYLSMKQLLNYTILMGYIETTDSENFTTDKSSARSELRKGLVTRGKGQYQQVTPYYDKKPDGSKDWDNPRYEYDWVLTRGQDKSGYPLNPTKYKDMLDSADLQTYGRQFERYTKKLEAVREAIIQYILNMDVTKGANTWSNNISSVMRKFEDALYDYKKLQDEIESILNMEDMSDEQKSEYIKRTFDGTRSFNSISTLRKTLEDCWELLKRLDENLQEKLTSNNFDEFKQIADEIGLTTAKDLENFRREEVQAGEDELTAIKRYKQELIDAGIDLSTLVNESIIRYPNGMEVTDIDLDRALDYQYGTDRNMDNSIYTDEEKQRAVDYWMEKTDPSPYKHLNEGAVKDVDIEILEEGGKKAYTEVIEKRIDALTSELNYLSEYAVREISKGGAFDSTEEIEEAKAEIEKEISTLRAKLDIVND